MRILQIFKHKRGLFGIIIVAIFILIAIFAPLLTPYSPYEYTNNVLAKPSKLHLLGTDKNGVDILSQLLYGTRVSLTIGILTGILVTLTGSILGIIAGYFHKGFSFVIMNTINVLLVIPTMPLMIIMHKVSSSYFMMIFIFVIFGWPGLARRIRAQVLSIKNMDYIKQAEISGASKTYIMFKHILPSISNILIMSTALSCAGFMIAEAGLSFMGLGDPQAISWGKILVQAQESAFTSRQWAWVIAPGIVLFLIVTGFINIGYALEDIYNPRIKIQNDLYKKFYKTKNEEIDKIFESMD